MLGFSRSEAQLFNVRHQPQVSVTQPGLAVGTSMHLMSSADDSGALSALVRVPAGWHFEGECQGATELFVLDGAIDVADDTLTCGGYCYLPEQAAPFRCASGAGATAYLSWTAQPTIRMTSVLVLQSFTLPWEATVLEGFPAGGTHKSLRPTDIASDAAHGGPDGFLRLVVSPPGWISPLMERHVGCWEENLLLRGDMLMPGRGRLRAGDCLANSPGLWHGPMVTKGGALFLVNCDAPMPVEYRDTDPGSGHPLGTTELERYLQTAPWD